MPDRYYRENHDLFLKAQKTGKYKMFLFDIVGSRELFTNDKSFYIKVPEFVSAVTSELLELEKKTGKKILHRHFDDFKNYNPDKNKDHIFLLKHQRLVDTPKSLARTDILNPLYWQGDLIHFIVERNTISDKDFYGIFEKHRKQHVKEVDFHFASGFYETDVWQDSFEKMGRVYMIPYLEYVAKYNKTYLDYFKIEKETNKTNEKVL